jgi:hypothetical protein
MSKQSTSTTMDMTTDTTLRPRRRRRKPTTCRWSPPSASRSSACWTWRCSTRS